MADHRISANGSKDIETIKSGAVSVAGQPPNVLDLGFTPFASSAETIAALERAELAVLQMLNDARK